MTTPAGYATPDRIIRAAMSDAGLLERGDDPSSEDYADYIQRLNDVINVEMTQGVKLFLLQDTAVTLVAGQQKYVFSPTGDVVMTKPLRVIQAYYLSSDSIRRPLINLSWNEWLLLGQVTVQGAINSYFVDKQASHLDMYLWNVPDTTAATGTVHALLETQATNMVSLTDDLMFPIEWHMFLRWTLAADIAVGQPQSIMMRCEQKAQYYKDILEDWDVEDSATRFEPDPRGQFYNNNFR
jgi:hypothetical protein